MNTSKALRGHWQSLREEIFADPDVKNVMAATESGKWRSMREIFGDPDLAAATSDPMADEEYARGVSLMRQGDSFAAEDAWWRADELGHPGAPRELFYLATYRGVDPACGASTELVARARERGDARAAAYLGRMARDTRDGGLPHLRFADQKGDPEGSRELGLRLKATGDLDGAEAAFRRSDKRGSSSGSLALGLFLRDERHDVRGAEAAFRHADERGHPKGSLNLIDLYCERGDDTAADAARDRVIELADRHRSTFPEMQDPKFLEYVRQVKGKTSATAGASGAGAAGTGCAIATVLTLLACATTTVGIVRALRPPRST